MSSSHHGLGRPDFGLPHRTPGQRHEDAGLTLIMLLGIMSVMTLFLMTSLTLVLNNARPSRQSQDSVAAVAAAEAGIEDYMARLAADSSYYFQGNSDASNPAFSAAGVAIAGGNSQFRRYRYELLTSPLQMAYDGALRVRVTGMSGPSLDRMLSRTLIYTIQPKSFLEYTYLSDVEALDPDLGYDMTFVQYDGPSTGWKASFYWNGDTRYIYVDMGPGVRKECGKYYKDWRWEPWTRVTPQTPVQVYDTLEKRILPSPVFTEGYGWSFSCQNIAWGTGDVVNGPLHTNDALYIIGRPLFTDKRVSTYWGENGKYWWGSGSPDPAGHSPYYALPINLPETNEEMKRWVEPRVDNPTGAPGPGCYYTGATRIIFQGTTMRVLSPGTVRAPSRCLDAGNNANEQVKPIPPVIYVDATTGSCNSVGYPKQGEWAEGITTNYDCHRGTAFIEGTVDSRVTVATLDDTVVTGNLVTKDNRTGTDMIGIVAGNYIWIYHPVDSTEAHQNLDPSRATRRIDAGMITLRHSLVVQNYNLGSPLSTAGQPNTKLQINGTIAQKFRGPVGDSEEGVLTSGYLKDYNYDPRFKTSQPPFFIKPVDAKWQIREIEDAVK